MIPCRTQEILVGDAGLLFGDFGATQGGSTPHADAGKKPESNSFTAGRGATTGKAQTPNVAGSWSSGPGRRVGAAPASAPTTATAEDAEDTMPMPMPMMPMPMPPVLTDGIKVREVSIADTVAATEAIVDAARTIGIGLRALAESTGQMDPVHKEGNMVHHKKSRGSSATTNIPDMTSGSRGRAVSDSVVGTASADTMRGISSAPSGRSYSSAAPDDYAASRNDGTGEEEEQTTHDRGRSRKLSIGWASTRPVSESPPRGRLRVSDRECRSLSPPVKKGGKEPLKELRGRMANGVRLVRDYDEELFSGCVDVEITSRFDALCAVGANVAKGFQDKSDDDQEEILAGRVVGQRVLSRSPLVLMYDVVFSSGVRQACDETTVRKYVDNFSNACMYLDEGALKPIMVQFV